MFRNISKLNNQFFYWGMENRINMISPQNNEKKRFSSDVILHNIVVRAFLM